MGKNDLKHIFKKRIIGYSYEYPKYVDYSQYSASFNIEFFQKLKQKTQGFDKHRNAVWRKQVEFLSLTYLESQKPS